MSGGAGDGLPWTGCMVVGEVAQAHDGSLGTAHAFVDAVADAGAQAVKFQTHIADAESTPGEPWRVRFSRQDATRYDYWRRMEFTAEQWAGLKAHAEERGLVFLSSPFSVEAVELLDRLGVRMWKVASGEVATAPMLDRMLATGRPMLLSTGMSGHAEIDALVARVRAAGSPFLVMQCTTMYPTPPEKVGLNVMADLARRHGAPVGLSDHSGRIYAGIAAATLGARMVEVHVTLSRRAFGPDVPASLDPDDLARLCEGVRHVGAMLGSPLDKDAEAAALAPLRAVFGKTWVAARDLPAGAVVGAGDLALKKAGAGLPAGAEGRLLGRVLAAPVGRGVPVTEDLLAADGAPPASPRDPA